MGWAIPYVYAAFRAKELLGNSTFEFRVEGKGTGHGLSPWVAATSGLADSVVKQLGILCIQWRQQRLRKGENEEVKKRDAVKVGYLEQGGLDGIRGQWLGI